MRKIAVFPGSFDPVTRGHESVIRRALPLFDKLVVAVGENSRKQALFPVAQRVEWLRQVFAGEPSPEIITYTGLTVDCCRMHGAQYILRGLRSSADFEFEREIGIMNKQLYPELETVFLLADPRYAAISSSMVREIILAGGDVKQFLPEEIQIKQIK